MADVLVVTSKVKKFVREKSGFNTSAELIESLSQEVEKLCLAAIDRAKADGRKTVKGRDLQPEGAGTPTS
jgi:histone H3/H4